MSRRRAPRGVVCPRSSSYADKRLQDLLHLEIGSDEGEVGQAIRRHDLEIFTDLHEIDDGHVVRAPSHVQPEPLQRRDVGLHEDQTADSQFGDPSGEDVPLQSGDHLLVDVLDGHDGGFLSAGDDVQGDGAPVVGVEADRV